MKTPGQERERLREALRGAYLEKENMEVDGRWKTRLMARVREVGPHRPPGFLPSFQRVVWRLAPVTSPLILIMILAVLFLRFDAASSYDALQSLVNSVEEWTVASIFST